MYSVPAPMISASDVATDQNPLSSRCDANLDTMNIALFLRNPAQLPNVCLAATHGR